MHSLKKKLIPEMTRTELDELIGWPSLSQVMDGGGIPEASQVRTTGFFTTTLTFSGTCVCPIMVGGTEEVIHIKCEYTVWE